MRKERNGVAGEEIFARGRNRDTWAALVARPYFVFTILFFSSKSSSLSSAVLDLLHPNHFHLPTRNFLKSLKNINISLEISAHICLYTLNSSLPYKSPSLSQVILSAQRVPEPNPLTGISFDTRPDPIQF